MPNLWSASMPTCVAAWASRYPGWAQLVMKFPGRFRSPRAQAGDVDVGPSHRAPGLRARGQRRIDAGDIDAGDIDAGETWGRGEGEAQPSLSHRSRGPRPETAGPGRRRRRRPIAAPPAIAARGSACP